MQETKTHQESVRIDTVAFNLATPRLYIMKFIYRHLHLQLVGLWSKEFETVRRRNSVFRRHS